MSNKVLVKIKHTGDHGTYHKLPFYAKKGDAGMDVYAHLKDPVTLFPGESVLIPLGFATEIPEGYFAYLMPRSGNALKRGLGFTNSFGTIDSGYRDEWKAIVINHGKTQQVIVDGERIGQLVVLKYPEVEFEVSEELSSSDRGFGGFGSTGTK